MNSQEGPNWIKGEQIILSRRFADPEMMIVLFTVNRARAMASACCEPIEVLAELACMDERRFRTWLSRARAAGFLESHRVPHRKGGDGLLELRPIWPKIESVQCKLFDFLPDQSSLPLRQPSLPSHNSSAAVERQDESSTPNAPGQIVRARTNTLQRPEDLSARSTLHNKDRACAHTRLQEEEVEVISSSTSSSEKATGGPTASEVAEILRLEELQDDTIDEVIENRTLGWIIDQVHRYRKRRETTECGPGYLAHALKGGWKIPVRARGRSPGAAADEKAREVRRAEENKLTHAKFMEEQAQSRREHDETIRIWAEADASTRARIETIVRKNHFAARLARDNIMFVTMCVAELKKEVKQHDGIDERSTALSK